MAHNSPSSAFRPSHSNCRDSFLPFSSGASGNTRTLMSNHSHVIFQGISRRVCPQSSCSRLTFQGSSLECWPLSWAFEQNGTILCISKDFGKIELLAFLPAHAITFLVLHVAKRKNFNSPFLVTVLRRVWVGTIHLSSFIRNSNFWPHLP